MPLLRASRPSTITSSLRALIGSSSEPDGLDYLNVDKAVADVNHRQSLAEKARFEVEQAREQERLRADPNAQNEYAATVSGAPLPMINELRAHLRGDMRPQHGPMPDGGNLPDAPAPMPEMAPEQARAARATLGSLMANRFATGKTNADQLTQAGGNLLTQTVRGAMAAAPDLATENQLGHSINIRPREPFSDTQAGILNQETGTVQPTPRANAIVEAVKAQAAMREAQGDAAGSRADAAWHRATNPAPARETDAQRREREARELKINEETAKLEEARMERLEANAMARFRQRPKSLHKGAKLGKYNATEKAWPVLDKDNNTIDWFR